MSVIAACLFLEAGVVISLFFFCMGCILKICVFRKKRRCTQKLQGRIASIEGFRTSNMPMVLIEFFWPERYLLPCLLESLSQPLWIGMPIEIWINPQNPYDFRISGQKYKNFSRLCAIGLVEMLILLFFMIFIQK